MRLVLHEPQKVRVEEGQFSKGTPVLQPGKEEMDIGQSNSASEYLGKTK